MRHEFGKCAGCHRAWAIVKLGEKPLCLKCFDNEMAGIGNTLKTFVRVARKAADNLEGLERSGK